MEQKIKCNKKAVLKFSGAFIAWVIGSGFATGQEVLQFFTSYGYRSYHCFDCLFWISVFS